MSRRIIVVGAGACGLAAAWSLADKGFEVTIVSRQGGATEMSSGAYDLDVSADGWSEDAARFLTELGLFQAPEADLVPVVATGLGVVRATRAVGRGLLDLAPLAGSLVLVADPGHHEWDARALARSYGESSWAMATGARFLAVSLPEVFSPSELRYPTAAFNRVLSTQERASALVRAGKHLGGEYPQAAALLLGPWLGPSPSEAVLGSTLRMGEVLHGPEGGFGLRYAQVRAQLITQLGISHIEGSVTAVHRLGTEVTAEVRDASGTRELTFDGMIVASGGLLGGGMRLRPLQVGAQHGWELQSGLTDRQQLSGQLSGWDPAAQLSWLRAAQSHRVRASDGIVAPEEPFWGHTTWGSAVECGCALAAQMSGLTR